MNESAHGVVGSDLSAFVRLVPERRALYDDDDLFDIAVLMDQPDTLNDGPDAEENLLVPAGYTYLGQFVDHDLTLDITSNLNPDDVTAPLDARTPAFDLDCVYGNGPSDQTYLYGPDHETLRIGQCIDDAAQEDLLRNQVPGGGIDPDGRAIIGDKRNDENSIVSQIQLLFIKMHNRLVHEIKAGHYEHAPGADVFAIARQELTWSYQKMLVEDYLRRLVEPEVYDKFVDSWSEGGDAAYSLYKPSLRRGIPLEFAGAAYRFGHSMVRTGYRLNNRTALRTFVRGGEAMSSLTGFQPLMASHVIEDWGRFFPHPENVSLRPGHHPARNDGPKQAEVVDGGAGVLTQVRLQFAYKIDPSITGSLDSLPARISNFDGGVARPFPPPPKREGPALSFLNLRRGNKYRLASGQMVADAMGITRLGVDVLMVREKTKNGWTFKPFPESLQRSTPLWLYILAEAQRDIVAFWRGQGQQDIPDESFLEGPLAITQLGPVGGRLVLETFFGLLDSDRRSYRQAPTTWRPFMAKGQSSAGDPFTFSRMLAWLKVPLTDGFGK